MSTNFNLAMLRNLHEPVSESLDAAIVQLSQYSARTMDPSTFAGAHHAHLVHGSLSVIGCRAAAKVAALLEEAMGVLPVPQTRGWSEDQAVQVARLCQSLSTQLLEHINRILSDMEDLPVRMWPTYRELYQHLASSSPSSPEDLYEPDPNFQNLKFAPLAEDYLSSVVRGAISRLREAIEKVESSSSKQELETGLQSALKVFDWVYSLRHARGYQAYWLALSARISMGLLDQEVLGDKGPWSVLLGEALIELEKFSRNNRRVDPELLGKTIRPLISRWPGHWAQSHPTLAETNERLGVSLFWDTLDEVEASQQAEPARANNDMPAILEQLKLAWGRYVVAEGASPDQVLVQSLDAFRKSYPEAVLAQAGADALMTTVVSSTERFPPAGEVSDAVSVEFAAAVLLLEDALEGRGRQASITDSQSSLQRRRLHASLNGSPDQLASLPRLRWDDKKHERMLRSASSAAFAQVQKDIAEIEESLVERLRDDHVSLDMAEISRRANQAAHVLEMLDAKPAATIATSLVSLVERVDRNQVKDMGQAVTLGIAALDTFLAARQAGDGEATHLLAEAYQAVTGEPMPYGYATEVDTDEVKRAAEDLINRSSRDADEVDKHEQAPAQEIADEPASSVSVPEVVKSRDETPRFDPSSLVEGCKVVRAGKPTESFFLEEMDHVLAEIAMQRGMLSSDPSDAEARQTLRRQFHTIKGSSRIAGFEAIGYAAERVERYLDRVLLARSRHDQADEAVVSRAVDDMKHWFSLLSSNQEAVVSAQMIDAWFEGVDEDAELLEVSAETSTEVIDESADNDQPQSPSVVDDVEVVAISGYGSMEYEAYYCMTEDLQKSLPLLESLAAASPEDAFVLEDLEGSLRAVMDIGESMGAPALARLPRVMLENAQASMSRTGLSSTRVFATDVLSIAARELGTVIRSLSEDRKMAGVDVDLLHALQSNTDFLRAGSSVQAAPAETLEGSGVEVVQPEYEETSSEAVEQGAQSGEEFMDALTQGMEEEEETSATLLMEEEAQEHIAAFTHGQDAVNAEDQGGGSPEAAESSMQSDVGSAMEDQDSVAETEDFMPAESQEAMEDQSASEGTGVSPPAADFEEEVRPSQSSATSPASDIDLEDEPGSVDSAQPLSSESAHDEQLDLDTAGSSAEEDIAEGADEVAEADHPHQPVVETEHDDTRSVEDSEEEEAEEDALWDEVFDNFEQISACLRKIGPLLVSLSERRK